MLVCDNLYNVLDNALFFDKHDIFVYWKFVCTFEMYRNKIPVKLRLKQSLDIYSNAKPATKAVRIEKNIVKKMSCITFRKTV